MRRFVVLLAGLITCALAPAAADAATDLATLPGAVPISSYRGVSAWSTPSPAGYRLTVSTGAAPRMLPVPPRAVPFDVDLGPGEKGQAVAVYSRCSKEPTERTTDGPPQSTDGGLPASTSGRGCDIYRVDVDGGAEQKLAGASTGQASETMPTIWRDEIAFARVYEQRQGARDGFALDTLPYLYVRRLDGEGGSQRQPGDSRGQTGTPGPVSLDLYGRRLGFLWEFQGGGETPFTRARVVTDGERTQNVATVGGGGSSNAWLSGTGFDAGRFLFGVECLGDPGGCDGRRHRVARYRLSTQALETALLPADAITAFSADAGAVELLAQRPIVPEQRDPTVACSSRYDDVATECVLVRVPDGELDYGPPSKGLRR